MRFSKANYLKLAVIVIAVFSLAGFAWTGGGFGSPRVDNTLVGTLGDAEREAISIAAFNETAKVYFSARCANCHPAGDTPTQGDEMSPHTQGVTRGKDGKGVYGQKCTTCHQSENLEGDHMPPGVNTAAGWHMPPASHKMPFQGITAGQLCRNFKDPRQNGGFKTAKEAMEHIHKRDPLVLWGWEPGNSRSVPPLTFDQFVAKVDEWLENGAACPE